MATTTSIDTIELQPIEVERVRKDSVHGILTSTRLSHEDRLTSDEAAQTTDDTPRVLSKSRAAIVITQLIGLQVFTSFSNGIIVVGLPAIAATLDIPTGLLLWPTSVFYLTAGSCLMLAGSVCDVIGTRPVLLAASLLLIASSLMCGLASNGGEIIAARGIMGMSNAMVVPASVSIISTSVEFGRPRNLGFACLGFAGPLGFLLGLVLGGVFVDGPGWRLAFYIAGASSFALSVLGFWVLPRNAEKRSMRAIGKQLANEVDFVGVLISSTGLATLSYVLAILSSDITSIRRPSNIALLIISASTVPSFIWWMNFQVKHNRPALIPNSLWRNPTFAIVCIMGLFIAAVSNGMELFSSLYFQQVQEVSAIGTSLRILPALVTAVVVEISTGFFVNRMPIMWVVLSSSVLTALSTLFMAIVQPQWPYWYMAFMAQILSVFSPDIFFTVGLLIVSSVFPAKTQALSGGVFSTCSQLGTSIGLTITAVISDSRTATSSAMDKSSPAALIVGYRAAFWTLFAWMVLICVLGAGGLRKVGKIGMKQD